MLQAKHIVAGLAGATLLLVLALVGATVGAPGILAQMQEEPGIRTIKTATPDPATVGQPLTYFVTVTNDAVSQRVGLRDFMPSSLEFLSATPSQGICGLNPIAEDKNAVDCTFGEIPSGESATVEIVTTPRIPENVTNTAVGEAEVTRPIAASSASVSVAVLAPEEPVTE